MYNQPYFIPGYYTSMTAPNMMRGASMLGPLGSSRGVGLLGRLGNGFSSLRHLNWGGFINNASKTLGVVNQTIPLVKQAGPMFRNMKSMLKVASVFKDETDKKPIRKNNRSHSIYSNHSNLKNQDQNHTTFHQNTSSTQPHYQKYSHIQDFDDSNLDDIHNENQTSDGVPTFFIG